MQIVYKKILSCDKKHFLNTKVYIPDVEPKAIFHIVHGMTEHIERYGKFMSDMANAGYIVFGYDHLGHGKTAKSKEEFGYIAKKDGFKLLINDVKNAKEAITKEYGKNLKYYLLGHSMGSFVVRDAVISGLSADKLIIMGTGGPNTLTPFGLFSIKVAKLLKGEKHISKTIDALVFSSYTKYFDKNDPYSWLTKDTEEKLKHSKDPLCDFKFTLSAMEDLLKLQKIANSSRGFKITAQKNMPILLVSGSDDPVGNYSKGVKGVYGSLKNNGADVRLKLYPSYRHEILNDSSYDSVLSDIKQFLNG